MKDLTERKVQMVLAKNNFREEEYPEPRKVLQAAGAVIAVASERALKTHGAISVKDNVVTDGKIVTAVGPSAAKKFGEKLVDVLSS